MKRVFCALFCIVLIIIYSCEKDDFCLTNPVTPNLVIRFYDADDEDDTKEIDSLYVWVQGKDSVYNNSETDSIAIPLNTLSTNTVYNLSHYEDGVELLETFTIQYDTEEDFVSRSCGFRVIFNDVSLFRETETWISSYDTNTITTINNQESAHFKIYH